MPTRLDEILADARARGVRTLFCCGYGDNGLLLAGRFDAHLLLEIDQKTMTARLGQQSRGNDWGRVGDSLAVAVEGFTPFVAAWRRFGAVIVDASLPVEALGCEVLMAAALALMRNTAA